MTTIAILVRLCSYPKPAPGEVYDLLHTAYRECPADVPLRETLRRGLQAATYAGPDAGLHWARAALEQAPWLNTVRARSHEFVRKSLGIVLIEAEVPEAFMVATSDPMRLARLLRSRHT